MSTNSTIEWTDATWNPTTGCERISPGCAHCYAKAIHDRRHKAVLNGKAMPVQFHQPFEVVRVREERLTVPLHWRRPRMVFVDSMSDLFHEDVPDRFISDVFAVMALTPEHTYQVLTKRPARMRTFLNDELRPAAIADAMDMPDWLPAGRRFPRVFENWPLPNVWLGVSVENQHFADERIPLLLQTPASVRFISAEPLLGAIDLTVEKDQCRSWLRSGLIATRGLLTDQWQPPLDWVIVGGESGADARPFEIAWARSIVRQCKSAGVSVFVKQLGAHVIDRNDAGFEGDTPRSWPMDTPYREDLSGFRDGYQGAPVRILLKTKGGDMNEWPDDLRIREFPQVNA